MCGSADATFFPEAMWVPQPSDWAPQNLRYAGYSLNDGEGLRIWNQCLPLAAMLGGPAADGPPHPIEVPARYGDPALVRRRLGQGAFRVAVKERPSTLRAWAGSMTPSSHIRAVA